MQNRDNDAATTGPDNSAIVQNSVYGKFTLIIDCDGLLKPDITRPDIFTSKSADEAGQYFQLRTLVRIPILSQIKVKSFHTCGAIQLDKGACLETLWSVGDWLVEQYRAIGKSAQYARYERLTDGGEFDGRDSDATLIVFIN